MADLFDGLEKINEKPVLQKGGSATVQRKADTAAGAEKVVDCELCIEKSPVYDFDMVCCRARFILGIPILDVRRAWIERWKKRDGAMGRAVEQEVTARWNEAKRRGGKRGRGA